MESPPAADRHNHPASNPAADAPLWSALFPRVDLDERATSLASHDHAHSDADEFSARALPVGLNPERLAPSRLTSFREPSTTRKIT